MRTSTAHNRRGFTIIELLVAVGITALLVTLMLTIVTNVLNGWNRSSGSLSSGNQARTILDHLSQDLQSVVLKRDGNVWLVANIQPDQMTKSGDANMSGADWTTGTNLKPKSVAADTAGSSLSVAYYLKSTTVNAPTAIPDINTYRFGQAGVWLRFFTTVPDVNTSDPATISAPRAVAYQIVRRQVGGEYRYQFFRSEARPAPKLDGSTPNNSTFDAGYDFSLTTGTNYNNADHTTDGNVGNIRSPMPTQLLASNVIDFGVRVWVKNSTTNNLDLVFPKSASSGSITPAYVGVAATTKAVTAAATATTDDTTTAFSAFPPGTPYVSAFPDEMDVFVRVLTDEGARLIANFEAGNIQAPTGVTADDYWWQLAIANSQVYTRRIQVKSSPF